jgi:hypothetical protein
VTAPVHLGRQTLPGLIAQWARIVDAIERRDTGGHDLRADIDVRHEIAGRVRTRPTSVDTREMLAELDAQYLAGTVASATCIHGADRAAAEGWTAAREWYYWRVPVGGGA